MASKQAIRKTLTALVIGATVPIVAVATAGASNASEVGYLQTLNDRGIAVYDAGNAIARGYEICRHIEHDGGAVAAADLFYQTTWSETPDLWTARAMVNAAANTLCPWTWANGTV